MAADSFIMGNPHANVAICTLWTLAKPIAERLPKEKFALCANLYSMDGINTIVRGVYANPHWRYLVVFGSDMTHTGDVIKAFFEHGVDAQGKVIGTNFSFQKEIPVQDLEVFRKHVKWFDLRGKSVDELAKTISSLEQLPPFTSAKEFPEPKLEEFPMHDSEKVGFLVRANTVSEGWLKILDNVMKFGEEKPTEHGTKMKEIVDIVAVIDGDEETIPSFMPCDANALKDYIPKLISQEKPENVVYTYGSRLRERIDQVQNAIDYLKEVPYTRRAIAVTWRMDEDQKHNKNPPCLTQIVWNVSHGKLHQTCSFRSHDMYEGWPLNMYGLRELQQMMAREVGIPAGQLVCLSISAHIYQPRWEEAKEVVKKHYLAGHYRFAPDPRGNFVISIVPGVKEGEKLILLQHFTPDGKKTPFIFHNTKMDEKQLLEELFTQLAHSNLISRLDHALYLGGELRKAAMCIRMHKEYVQDQPIQL